MDMLKRSALVVLVATVCAPMLVSSAGATSTLSQRPDAWIKLCGQSNGCVIDPLPHPWYGKNVYNTTARHQTVRERIDNGEGVRFWIMFQNDGTQTDTYMVHGCRGTMKFRINAVIVGKYKDVVGGTATHITQQFMNNTATFTLAPGDQVAITLNIITASPNLTYRCPVSITSTGDPTKKDTVAAVMTTF